MGKRAQQKAVFIISLIILSAIFLSACISIKTFSDEEKKLEKRGYEVDTTPPFEAPTTFPENIAYYLFYWPMYIVNTTLEESDIVMYSNCVIGYKANEFTIFGIAMLKSKFVFAFVFDEKQFAQDAIKPIREKIEKMKKEQKEQRDDDNIKREVYSSYNVSRSKNTIYIKYTKVVDINYCE